MSLRTLTLFFAGAGLLALGMGAGKLACAAEPEVSDA